jgi:hypothetical protein
MLQACATDVIHKKTFFSLFFCFSFTFQYTDYWGPSKRIFNIEEFYTFDIETISPEAIKKIKTEYLTKDEFQIKTIRSTSVALGNLFRWCLAIIRRYEEKYPTIATSTPDENENKEETAQPKKVKWK